MALLSTLDSSIFSLAFQFALVAMQAFRLLPQWVRNQAIVAWHRGLLLFVRKSLKFQRSALRQRWEELSAFAD